MTSVRACSLCLPTFNMGDIGSGTAIKVLNETAQGRNRWRILSTNARANSEVNCTEI